MRDQTLAVNHPLIISRAAAQRSEMPVWIPSCQVNRVTERFGSDKNSCRPLLAKTAALTLGLHTVCIMDRRDLMVSNPLV